MSLNAALNATLALIEGRTDLARSILRSPGSDVKNVPDILARLDRAVNKVAAQAIRNALIQTLAVQPPKVEGTCKEVYEDGFYTGVSLVEKVLEDAASSLECRTES